VRHARSFPNEPASVTAARNFVKDTLQGVASGTVQAVELMVSELATNCVRHTDDEFEIIVEQGPEEIRVEATDRGGGEPRLRSPGPMDAHGRGLLIIDALAGAWGVDRGPGQKKLVWFEVSAPAPARECLTGCA
jgi:anti-sigma regulatory factor (Ser/Thr protein kinase)